jgi:F0F1-type ATP synthase delta subunit
MSKLPRHLIAEVIAQRSLENIPSQRLAREIAAYMMSQRRTTDIESLLRDIMQYRADHGIVEVFTTSASQLNAVIRKNIEAQVRELYPSAKQIIISEQIDDNVVGGIRVELANQQFDASIRTKLNHFKQLTAAGKD